MAVTVLAGLASGVYAQSAIEQLEDLSSSKVVPAPATAEPALLSADNAVCSPESAEANYIKRVTQGGEVTNLKINTSTVQFGNNERKIVIIGSYLRETPEFGVYGDIPMASYAFYNYATCAIGENLSVMTHAVK